MHADCGATFLALTPRELLLVDAIAERVAELQRGEVAFGATGMVDAATLAATLGVSRAYVYAHWQELGGKRLGSGPRGRLRFDLDRAARAVTPCSASKRSRAAKQSASPAKSAPRRRKRTGSGSRLLPIKGVMTPLGPDWSARDEPSAS
jgi:hypothetical protein